MFGEVIDIKSGANGDMRPIRSSIGRASLMTHLVGLSIKQPGLYGYFPSSLCVDRQNPEQGVHVDEW